MILGPATVTLTDASNVAILAQAKVSPGAVGELFASTCDLIVAPISVTGATQFGDLTLPAWVAYAAQAIVWTAPFIVSTGLVEMDAASVTFTIPAGGIGQTIYGWAISDSSPRLAAVGILETPILINAAQPCIVVPVIPWQSTPVLRN